MRHFINILLIGKRAFTTRVEKREIACYRQTFYAPLTSEILGAIVNQQPQSKS
jgi:hypothetical protein